MLQPPAILIGVVLASIYALSYALLIGKTGNRIWWYWLFGQVGFFLGVALADYRHWTSLGLGQLPIVESSVTSVAMLVLATILRR